MSTVEPSAAPAGLSRHPRILRPLSSRQPVKRYLAVPAPPCKAAKLQQELHGPLVYDGAIEKTPLFLFFLRKSENFVKSRSNSVNNVAGTHTTQPAPRA
jgi:hypothetical protein